MFPLSASADWLRFDEMGDKLRFLSDYLFLWNGEVGSPTKKSKGSASLFFSRLPPFRSPGAELLQFIGTMPSLTFDEPGRISQHLSFLLHPYD